MSSYFNNEKNKDTQIRLGDKLKATMKLYECLYGKNSKKTGYCKEDLEDDFIESLRIFLKAYDPERGSSLNFFKTIYEKQIASGIREKRSPTNQVFYNSLGKTGNNWDGGENAVDLSTYNENVCKDDLVKDVAKNVCNNKSEKIILLQGILGILTYKEVAKKLNINYSTACSRIRSEKIKIRNYISKKGYPVKK